MRPCVARILGPFTGKLGEKLLEIFTAFYSKIPEHMEHFRYLYVGLEGHNELAPWMWLSALLVVVAALLLVVPRTRKAKGPLTFACIAVIVSIWIDKGLGMIVTGFIPSPLGHVTSYVPTLPELMITLGVYAGGALLVTVLYKVALAVRGELMSQ